jgi:tRNA threonylcarbamoyl adenosine modification protein (Sua5/YciO/YrdC/YwlC family)
MQLIDISPENPADYKIKKIVEAMRKGAVIIYPTDSKYAFGCDLFNKDAIERLSQLKNQKIGKMQFSFICKDISQVSEYARQFDNSIFKMMKKALPGPYTFILNASQLVPKIVQTNKKTVGVRIPNNSIALALVEELGNPLITSTVNLDLEEHDYGLEPWYMAEYYQKLVDFVIDSGTGVDAETTVLDCTTDEIVVVRQGLGEIQE